MYAVCGATGNTGSVVARRLLAAGQKVRVIGRNMDRLQPFVAQGAEGVVAELTDKAALVRAFDGVRAVYAMIPPDYGGDLRAFQAGVADALAAAIAEAGVGYAVSLSSIGADKAGGTGPIAGLHEFENKLDAVARLNVLHLRPGYFFENLLMMIPSIRQTGTLVAAFRPDLPIAMVATRDIGARAAQELLKLEFTGHSTRELRAPQDYTFSEVARILGDAIGHDGLSYRQLPYEAFEEGLVHMGFPRTTAALFREMTAAFNDGRVAALEPRCPENTAPTTLEQWAREVFAPAYQGKGATA
ncbi:MAG TPA: NmrA family NAD(P)-binding protein [Bryobacteraceae bacterium]|nr:NmrA family NAD(P)-binding protein [Bryobacteraceae bacterium]